MTQRLPNNMISLMANDRLTHVVRDLWNTNFSRCVVRVTAGKGIRVDEMNGEVVVSAVDDSETSGASPPPFMGVYTGDNVWIQVIGNTIYHTAATVGIGTYNIYPIGTSVSSGSTTFHQRVYRHDINGHVMGTHLGSGTIHTVDLFTLGTQRRVHQVVFDGTTFREIWSIEWVVLGGGTGTVSTTIFTGTTC